MKRKTDRQKSLNAVIRIVVAGLMLPMLSSCVTYYYPAPEQTEGVYYAADDPGYSGSSVDYVAVSYYPWWSVDYFYLGYGHRSSNWSIGISYGSPWWPRYSWGWYPYGYASWWYYDPWPVSWWHHPPYYWAGYPGHHHYWHVHNRHHWDRYDYHHGDRGYHHANPGHYAQYEDPRYGRDRQRYGEPSDDDYGRYRSSGNNHGRYAEPSVYDPSYRSTGQGRNEAGAWDGTGATQRRVTVSPDSGTTDRGMVVASRDGGKWSRNRLEPVGDRSSFSASDGSASKAAERARPTQPTGSRSEPGSPSSAYKARRSRTTPISGPVRVSGQQSRTVRSYSSASPTNSSASAKSRSSSITPITEPVDVNRARSGEIRSSTSRYSTSRSAGTKTSRSRTMPHSNPIVVDTAPPAGVDLSGPARTNSGSSSGRLMPAKPPASYGSRSSRSTPKSSASRPASRSAPARSASKSRSKPASAPKVTKSRSKRDR